MKLTGLSLLEPLSESNGSVFSAVNPANGEALEPRFHAASLRDVDTAAQLAEEAFKSYGKLPGREKAILLRQIASGMDAATEELIARAHLETGLPPKRLNVETTRTTNQLRMFAQFVEEGSWVSAKLDRGDPSRSPVPKPDIRSMLRPLGPVAVFGASNFPFAYSVAGGDTASALAAGNPVIVKAHPSHPGTSELVGQVISQAIRNCNLPAGVFSLLFDAGNEIGSALVQHPLVKAVGFTGSQSGGKALMHLATSRPEPIPCFAEMGSSNPVFITPQALATRSETIATGLFESFTSSVGQMCTKPGLVFIPNGSGKQAFIGRLQHLVSQSPAAPMLNANICSRFRNATAERKLQYTVQMLAEANAAPAGNGFFAVPVLYEVDAKKWLQTPELAQEVFGPTTLLVSYSDSSQLLEIARNLEGHLTAALHATEDDPIDTEQLTSLLERKAGRLIMNGFPTGVEVCHAMVHGGPYPATSDGRSTSVGSQAIYRFTRPVCYQSFPQQGLPPELRDGNPLGILRLVNGEYTRQGIGATG
ncbi:MAG TPA: aldehyde dehydrogenase (NADP(+)) [Acidobacteriaceae bacterium]|nr:aldehyde dehydrogenase (NADP(+)) [Acidobacteriaceae bacterium]